MMSSSGCVQCFREVSTRTRHQAVAEITTPQPRMKKSQPAVYYTIKWGLVLLVVVAIIRL